MIRSQKKKVRIAILQNRASDLGDALSSPVMAGLKGIYPEGGWKLPLNGRNITVIVPDEQLHGDYIVKVSGDPKPLLNSKIDTYASQFSFHRTSNVSEEITFNTEWTGAESEQYAYGVLYLINTLNLLSKSIVGW